VSLLSGIAIFFIIWWLCLFVVLPFGVKSQHETQEIVPGSDPGAPHKPMLLRRVLATTLLAAIVFGGVWIYFGAYERGLEDLLP
jgi:predicted secreted protein